MTGTARTTIVAALLAATVLAGCGGPGPDEVTAEYLRCLAVHDVEGLRKVVAESVLPPALAQAEARRAHVFEQSLRRGIPAEETREFYARTMVDLSHLPMRVERPGDIAVVYPQGYADVVYPDNETLRQDFDGKRAFRLVRENGRWKVWP
jgi:hypothetical protein